MYTRKEYAKDQNDPRWQETRKRIFERDDYRCELCDWVYDPDMENSHEPHCHHKRYNHDSRIWEYPDSDLMTLCPHHHALIHGWLTPSMSDEQEKKLNYISKSFHLPLTTITQEVIEDGLKSRRAKDVLRDYDDSEEY